MNRTSYTILLTEKDKKKVVFSTHKGRVTYFSVHYYSLIDGRWRSIIRFDTAHGRPHKHTFHKDGREYRVDIPGDYGTIFTEAVKLITRHFEGIKRNYLH